MKHLDKIYKQGDISWFTPVELFKVCEEIWKATFSHAIHLFVCTVV